MAEKTGLALAIASFGRWLTTRVGLIWIWIAATLAVFGGVLCWHYLRSPLFTTTESWLWLFTASNALLLPVVLLALDPPDNYARGPRRRLPLITLGLLVAVALFAIAEHNWHFGLVEANRVAPIGVALLLAFLIAFAARMWNAANFANFDAERRIRRADEARAAYLRDHLGRYPDADQAAVEQKFDQARREDEVTSVGALLITAVVIAIGVLAYVVGNGTEFSLQGTFGFFLCFGFIGIFVVIVLIGVFDETPVVRGVSRTLYFLADAARPINAFYGAIDTFLVRIAAPTIGMSHRTAQMRYLALIGTMTTLVVMGIYLPPPLGLVPVFVGFALAIAVSRLWNWVEEDRSLAALTGYKPSAPYQTDLSEDYLDETLLAFAFVFLLAPIAMMQASDGEIFGSTIFRSAAAHRVEDWIGFFGLQLANALPILGWAQIYGIETRVGIDIDSAASRHAVFLSRIMIDLVLIAALIQAIGVMTRSRQQKALYRAGHINRLDPFVERAEFARAIRATRTADGFDLSKLGGKELVDFRVYDEAQLRLIYSSDLDGTKRDFIRQIATERGMSLMPSIETAVDLAENNGDQVELINAFTRAESEVGSIEPDDLFRMLSALRSRTGLRDFKERIVNVLERVADPAKVIEVLSGLAAGPSADQFLYARRYMAEAIRKAQLRIAAS